MAENVKGLITYFPPPSVVKVPSVIPVPFLAVMIGMCVMISFTSSLVMKPSRSKSNLNY